MAVFGVPAGALFCALAIIAGAFGAHGLEGRLDAKSLALWETAFRYFMYGGLGWILVGLVAGRQAHGGYDLAALFLCLGSLVFSGTVAVLALGGPRWLGAVTPLGGLLLISGFLVFGWTAWRLS